MAFRTSITKRRIPQKNRVGKVFYYDRYLLNYKDPATGKKRIERHNTRREADEAQAKLLQSLDTLGRRNSREPPTLKEAVDYWLDCKKRSIQDTTFRSYKQVVLEYIVGPALKASPWDKMNFAKQGGAPSSVQRVIMLGPDRRIDEITTAELRQWLHRLREVTSGYNLKVIRKHIASIFRLIEEDYEIRLARVPSRMGKPHRRQQRLLLTEEQARLVIEEAQRDKKWGVYYAFLLFTGVRPSEMFGLRWDEVDLERGFVRICRVQDHVGGFKESPKTEAGNRTIPINSQLRQMLQEWRERCPRHRGQLYRVFPAQGHPTGKGRAIGAEEGGPLLLNNFRLRVWFPLLKRLGLPRVTLYAMRHMVISHLQAQGVEIGVVAKIAGHSSPQVTLQYYTHAVRDFGDAMEKLDTAFGLEKTADVNGTQVQI